MTITDYIIEKLNTLPDTKQREVLNFVEALVAQGRLEQQGPLQQEWAGALKDFRDKYTSLELQRKASEWRSD
ncbi:MAG: DUF2281 domain-containing protein [Chloroflexi bacterium]|nr:DUF2281 domain-containing protein [Chloroflexota bacterium]MCI0796487.1 DUF2281 domain-containing protein [Chloroflexota bacterium]